MPSKVVPIVSVPMEYEESITKVKLKGDEKDWKGGSIAYTSSNQKGDSLEVTLHMKEKPHGDLFVAMNGLINLVIREVHLDFEGWVDANVSGLTLTDEGLVVTMQATRFQACVNTPLLKLEDLAGPEQFLIRLVEKEARAYLHGKREQMSLDFGAAV